MLAEGGDGTYGRPRWRQFLVITDERVAIVEMTPALYGWNIGRVTIQQGEDWPGMSAERIYAWKRANDPGLTEVLLESLGDFAPKLLQAAGGK